MGNILERAITVRYGFRRSLSALPLVVALAACSGSEVSIAVSDLGDAGDGGDGAAGQSPFGDASADVNASPVLDATLVPDAPWLDGSADAGTPEVEAANTPSGADDGFEGDDEGSVTDDGPDAMDSGAASTSDGGMLDAQSLDAADDIATDAGDGAAVADVEDGSAVADAEDGGADSDIEAGLSMTYKIILAAQGTTCAACALNYCLGSGQTCESLGSNVATEGPAIGTSRTTLCYNTLSCVISTTASPPCYDQGALPFACYCGAETSPQCGLETTDPMTAYSRIESPDTTLGSQMANAVAECLDGVDCANVCLF
jgi:hypothetical protein